MQFNLLIHKKNKINKNIETFKKTKENDKITTNY